MYRLNWTRRTPWRWWDEWDNTVLQTRDSKFVVWRSEAEHATSWSQRLPTILNLCELHFVHNTKYIRVSGEETFCFLETWMPERGDETAISDFLGRQHQPGSPPHNVLFTSENTYILRYLQVKIYIFFYIWRYRLRGQIITINTKLTPLLWNVWRQSTVALMLDHRLRRCTNIKTTVVKSIMFAG